MIGGSDTNAIAVFGFVVEAGVSFELIILDGEEGVVGGTCSGHEAIGEGVAGVRVGGGKIANDYTEAVFFVDGAAGEGEIGGS